MTPPTDSLEAVLDAVPLICVGCGRPLADVDETVSCRGPWARDSEALATATRKWIKQNMPNRVLAEWARETDHAAGYNHALANVAEALGLSETIHPHMKEE